MHMQQRIGYIFITFVLLTVFLTAYLVWKDYKNQSEIGSYDACVASGGSVMLQQPDRCVLPSGQTFEREIEAE